MTGVKFERKGLDEALAYMRSEDTLVVWKLDRLGRSLKDLIETLNLLPLYQRNPKNTRNTGLAGLPIAISPKSLPCI